VQGARKRADADATVFRIEKSKNRSACFSIHTPLILLLLRACPLKRPLQSAEVL
jgi:hypothetical protein